MADMSRYRRAGADLPWQDPCGWHGGRFEGYFWRFTGSASRDVVIVMCGVCRAEDGDWGFVGTAAHPGGFFESRVIEQASAERHRMAVRAGDALQATPGELSVRFGSVEIEARLEPAAGPRRILGAAHLLPGLTQYWHPHVLGARASVRATIDGRAFEVDRVYAEKNWGAGFPDRWWWGQTHDFAGGDEVCLAFAGGPAGFGRARVAASAAVLQAGDRVWRMGPPARAEASEHGWRLRGRAGLDRIEIEGAPNGVPAHALTVPLPLERRAVHGSHHHLAGDLEVRVTRRGRTQFRGTSTLAGLEYGANVAEASLWGAGSDVRRGVGGRA